MTLKRKTRPVVPQPMEAEDIVYSALIDEGYGFRETEEKDESLKARRIIVDVIKDGQRIEDAQVTFLVADDFNTIVIENFKPKSAFPKERRGRGRALLRHLLNKPEYAGYAVTSYASPSLQESFLKMTEFHPMADIEGETVYNRVGKRKLTEMETDPELIAKCKANPPLAEKLKELWFTANLYGVVPGKSTGST